MEDERPPLLHQFLKGFRVRCELRPHPCLASIFWLALCLSHSSETCTHLCKNPIIRFCGVFCLSVFQCCLHTVLRAWLEASQFPFLSGWLNPHPNHFSIRFSHSRPQYATNLISPGPGTKQLGIAAPISRIQVKLYSYANQSILSLFFALPCPFLPIQTTVRTLA